MLHFPKIWDICAMWSKYQKFSISWLFCFWKYKCMIHTCVVGQNKYWSVVLMCRRKKQSNVAAAGNNTDDIKTFTVPCNIDVQLDKATVSKLYVYIYRNKTIETDKTDRSLFWVNSDSSLQVTVRHLTNAWQILDFDLWKLTFAWQNNLWNILVKYI